MNGLKIGSILLRKAEERDIQTLAVLDSVCFSAPWSEVSFRQEIMDNKLAFYLVAEEDGEIIGYGGMWSVLGEGHITNIAVHPEYRRKGVGKLIVSALIETSSQWGVKAHTLEVRVSNRAAIDLYSHFGFRTEGVRKGYYEDNGEDAYIMWRNMDERME